MGEPQYRVSSERNAARSHELRTEIEDDIVLLQLELQSTQEISAPGDVQHAVAIKEVRILGLSSVDPQSRLHHSRGRHEN